MAFPDVVLRFVERSPFIADDDGFAALGIRLRTACMVAIKESADINSVSTFATFFPNEKGSNDVGEGRRFCMEAITGVMHCKAVSKVEGQGLRPPERMFFCS